MFWRENGIGVRVCVAAQRIWFPTARTGKDRVSEADRAITARWGRYGIRYRKVRCQHCDGYHLERV
jgi:hypothetical protein